MSTTLRATCRTNFVHHVGHTSLELSKFRVGFSLGVLTRSNFFVKMSFELSNKRIGHFRDVDTFSFCNISQRLGSQFGLQLFSSHTKNLGNCFKLWTFFLGTST